jgi:hypothetical protein
MNHHRNMTDLVRRIAILTGILGVFPALGQTLALSSGSTAAGSPVDLTLSLSGSSPIASLQFTLSYYADDFSAISVKAGSAVTAAGKTLSCSNSPGRTVCMVWGLTNATIGDGDVGVVTANPAAGAIAALRQIKIIATAVSGGAVDVPIKVRHGVVSISTVPVSSLESLSCSTLRPGKASNCSVTMTAPVSSKVEILLASSNSSLSTPASVTIASGKAKAPFRVTLQKAIEKGTATLKATFNNVSKTAVLTW